MKPITRVGAVLILCSMPFWAAWANAVMPDSEQISRLVVQLGADTYRGREAAQSALWEIGEPALPLLHQVSQSPDPEIKIRANRLIWLIERGVRPDWSPELIKTLKELESLDGKERWKHLEKAAQLQGVNAAPLLLNYLEGADAKKTRTLLTPMLEDLSVQTLILQRLNRPENETQADLFAEVCIKKGTAADLANGLARPLISSSMRSKLTRDSIALLKLLYAEDAYLQLVNDANAFRHADPDEARFLYFLGLGYAFTSQTDKADQVADQALLLRPGDEQAHYQAGALLEELHQMELAKREWERILEIPSDQRVYDINAHMRLASLYEKRTHYLKAADQFEQGLRKYREGKASGDGLGMVGAKEEQLEAKIQALRKKAHMNRFDLSAKTIRRLAEEEREKLKQAREASLFQFELNVEPYGRRIFEDAPITILYNPQAEQVEVLLNGTSRLVQRKLAPPKPGDTFLISHLDRVYEYAFLEDGLNTERTATFDFDYTLKITCSEAVLALEDLTLQSEGTFYTPEQLAEGLVLDFLPQTIEIHIKGTLPDGSEVTGSAKMDPRKAPVDE